MFDTRKEVVQTEWTIGHDYKGWDYVKERYCGEVAKVERVDEADDTLQPVQPQNPRPALRGAHS